MTLIDADKFLLYLIYSKHIDGLTCEEVKKAVEMCEVNVFDKIRTEIQKELKQDNHSFYRAALEDVIKIIDRYEGE